MFLFVIKNINHELHKFCEYEKILIRVISVIRSLIKKVS